MRMLSSTFTFFNIKPFAMWGNYLISRLAQRRESCQPLLSIVLWVRFPHEKKKCVFYKYLFRILGIFDDFVSSISGWKPHLRSKAHETFLIKKKSRKFFLILVVQNSTTKIVNSSNNVIYNSLGKHFGVS